MPMARVRPWRGTILDIECRVLFGTFKRFMHYVSVAKRSEAKRRKKSANNPELAEDYFVQPTSNDSGCTLSISHENITGIYITHGIYPQ